MNVSQNNIIRFTTGLSKNSHMSNTRNVLKIMNIQDLFKYMKLIFVKNVKNNSFCNLKIFKYILNANFKNNKVRAHQNWSDIKMVISFRKKCVPHFVANFLFFLKKVTARPWLKRSRTRIDWRTLTTKCHNIDKKYMRKVIYEYFLWIIKWCWSLSFK